MTVVHDSQTPPLRVLDDTLHVLLRSADSPHRMAAMTVEVKPGGLVPPHRHRDEEEGYFVLSGELVLLVGDREHCLRAGDFAHVPPRTVHGYRNATAQPVRFLAWTVGGAMDRFFEEMSARVRSMPADAPVMMELAARYGVEMLGGPPPA